MRGSARSIHGTPGLGGAGQTLGARPGLPGLPAMRSAPTAPASLRKWPSHCRRHSRHHANSVQPGLGSPKRLSCSAVPGATRVLGTRRGRQTQRKDSATRRPGGGSCPAAGRSPQGRMRRSGRPRLPGSTAWTEPAGRAPAPAGLGARGACRARAGTAPALPALPCGDPGLSGEAGCGRPEVTVPVSGAAGQRSRPRPLHLASDTGEEP